MHFTLAPEDWEAEETLKDQGLKLYCGSHVRFKVGILVNNIMYLFAYTDNLEECRDIPSKLSHNIRIHSSVIAHEIHLTHDCSPLYV